MIRNNIPAKVFYDSNHFESIYNDYLKWQSLSDIEKDLLFQKQKRIEAEETPALALKRHGTLPPENWLELTEQIREKKNHFYDEHPYFCLIHIVEELESVVNANGAKLVNKPRNGRASIKQVNILNNGEYLVVVYNRLINSTQTSTVFSGVPIKYIQLIEHLSFLEKYIPDTNEDFLIRRKVYSFTNSVHYELLFD